MLKCAWMGEKKKKLLKHLRVFSSTQACLFASLSHTCARTEEVNRRNNPEGTAGWHFHPAPVSPRAKRNSLAYGTWLNDGGANTHGFLATHTQNVSQRHRLTNPSFTMMVGRLKMRTVCLSPPPPCIFVSHSSAEISLMILHDNLPTSSICLSRYALRRSYVYFILKRAERQTILKETWEGRYERNSTPALCVGRRLHCSERSRWIKKEAVWYNSSVTEIHKRQINGTYDVMFSDSDLLMAAN